MNETRKTTQTAKEKRRTVELADHEWDLVQDALANLAEDVQEASGEDWLRLCLKLDRIREEVGE